MSSLRQQVHGRVLWRHHWLEDLPVQVVVLASSLLVGDRLGFATIEILGFSRTSCACYGETLLACE